MTYLCKYKDILGSPKEGLHSIRIFDIAIIDVLLTLVLAYLISYISKFKINIYVSILISFVLGIILHRIFCVNTTMNTLIFGKV